LPNPAAPPSLWNLFRGNNLSGKPRNRAGGIQGKEKPISDEEDGISYQRVCMHDDSDHDIN
jgi:hypothetical protein